MTRAGGNESPIPKRFSSILRPLGWEERQLNARLLVDEEEVSHDSHKVDYLKGRVAFDLEWNSKDQTFDRDLYAFRAFFDYGKISLGILATRSNELDPWIASLGEYTDKYGTKRNYKNKFGPARLAWANCFPGCRRAATADVRFLCSALPQSFWKRVGNERFQTECRRGFSCLRREPEICQRCWRIRPGNSKTERARWPRNTGAFPGTRPFPCRKLKKSQWQGLSGRRLICISGRPMPCWRKDFKFWKPGAFNTKPI